MAITFGVTVLPDPPYTRFLELLELAEQQGFDYGWTYDSHVLWHESIPLLTLAAEHTSRMKLGHFVTNPGTRDPTVLASAYATMHVISEGRMVMGIGRGDSARRVIGQQPVEVAELEEACRKIKQFMNGQTVDWNGKELKLEWARTEPEIPMYIAGYGPKALAVAGRDPEVLECIVGAPSKVSDDIVSCREEVRWFPAMVSNHVMDLIEKYGWNSDIPSELTDFVKTRKGYDYKDHSRVGAKHGEFVTDEICERFSVIGDAEKCRKKLRELEAVGVDQFNIYLMTHGQEETLEAYGREIIPQFAGVTP